MALETGTYISDLVVTNPTSSDPKSQGDDHFRLLKNTIKNTFPNITGAVTPTHTELNYVDGVLEPIQTQLDRKPNRNLIINPEFNINQRAYSKSATHGDMTADAWKYNNTSDSVCFVSFPTTVVPTVAQAGRLIAASVKIDPTTADASIAAGQFVFFEQRVEGYDFLDIAQRSFTYSFWARHPKTGTYCVSFRNSVPDRSYVAEYTCSAANTWEYHVINVPASPSAGTWDYGNGIGLSVSWCLACGSTFQTTAGAWQTGNYLATANQVNAVDTVLGATYIADPKLEVGDYDTSRETLDIASEVQRCERRYEVGIWYMRAYSAAGTTVGHRVNYHAAKRANPTIVLSNQVYTNGSNLAVDSLNPTSGLSLRFTVTALGAAIGQGDWTSSADL